MFNEDENIGGSLDFMTSRETLSLAMHAGKAPYSSRAPKHGAPCNKYFTKSKTSPRFPNFRASNAWQMGHNSPRPFFFRRELLLDFAAWIDLTSFKCLPITPLRYIGCLRSFRTHFDSLKRVDDLRVCQGFMMPLNHQAGIQGTLNNA